MSDDDLLTFLEAEQAQAFQYTNGEPASARQKAMRDYLRFPYGTEQEGRSQVVASDVFDAVEGMLPELVEVFVSSDKAVVFDPVSPEDEAGAKQATDACNYVFYKQNNGFLVLYTAAKDALLLRTGGVKWWWEVKRTPNFETFSGDELQIASHLIANPKAQVIGKEELDPEPVPEEIAAQYQAMGMDVPPQPPRYKVRLKTVEEKGKVCVEPIPPYELEIAARHNSILLDDCPYVCHKSEKSYSDIIQMGFDVTEDEVRAAKDESITQDEEFYSTVRGSDVRRNQYEQEASVRGWIREEYVLVDFDGDGITERRKIIRLGKKILQNEEFSHVPIAGWTPYLLTHKFDGLSVWDLVQDIQRLNTDILRNQADNLALANNQETVILTDANGNPKANIDDVLNRRVGGVMRESVAGAIRPYTERWQGIEAMPFIERLRSDKESRIGWAPYLQQEDAETLSNKTATEIAKGSNARQKRIKLMARMMAEAMVKPMFRGIFKTLTDYCMEKLSFRLNGQFVQYDPQEWRDGYDMTVNVGIGQGDTLQQMQFLTQLAQAQAAIGQSPVGPILLDAEKVYNLQARLIELAGFKNPNDFINKPPRNPDGSIVQPQPQPNPDVVKEQAKGQVALQIEQQRGQLDIEKKKADLQVQAANDARDAQREERRLVMEHQAKLEEIAAEDRKHQRDIEFQMWKAQLDAATKIEVANVASAAKVNDAATQAATGEVTEEIGPDSNES